MQVATTVRQVLRDCLRFQSHLKRNYGITAVMLQKAATDPVQKLFVEKIREYSSKSKSAGGKLVEASPEIEMELKNELEKLQNQYGGGAGKDITSFPTFSFKEPELDSIDMEQQK